MVKSEVPIRLKLEKSIKTIEDRLKRGHELLENGFALEAADQFEQCTGADVMFAPAWEGLAAAYRHLGREKEAEECRKQAQHIRQALWERQVEYEIRKQTKISGEK
ncbi:MAG: hypothetical protein GTO45_40440 [Candidatus Aminicenantes bacterium]|nr:hypothetical protein [Candidatus Aminicenantes bacterium]NIM84878.1 hypothetical protein [Candidatus Aminicenantes bacterium]NIN24386.1 hypothetical protein [Candidatus Aminicenantes bacterium]NIN48150.1 hypothetical protein [Candidatus Aminicenantes bacterium]NIN91053.1 hypothetical protein [Candidatus Aminicenantes bacterium]